MNTEVVIKASNISKRFRIPHEKYESLKQNAINAFKKRTYSDFTALSDVSFEVRKGEFFGIVGKNGSGKSTLLKILAQIYQPTDGSVEVKGTLAPFIELGVGFNPELSARDNVYLNGAILGLTRKQIDGKFKEIIDFAELHEFVDQKLKNFSSGMQVRLAFSISIQSEADILLVDEVLAVGDTSFQKKCYDVFRSLKKQGKTIVFVTHDMGSVVEFCNRAIVISDSKKIFDGSPDEAANIYLNLNQPKEKKVEMGLLGKRLLSVTTTSGNKEKKTLKPYEDFECRVRLAKDPSIKSLGVAIFSEDDTYIFGTNTIIDDFEIGKSNEIVLKFKNPSLGSGRYYFKIGIFEKSDKDVLEFHDRVGGFQIKSTSKTHGIVVLEREWSK